MNFINFIVYLGLFYVFSVTYHAYSVEFSMEGRGLPNGNDGKFLKVPGSEIILFLPSDCYSGIKFYDHSMHSRKYGSIYHQDVGCVSKLSNAGISQSTEVLLHGTEKIVNVVDRTGLCGETIGYSCSYDGMVLLGDMVKIHFKDISSCQAALNDSLSSLETVYGSDAYLRDILSVQFYHEKNESCKASDFPLAELVIDGIDHGGKNFSYSNNRLYNIDSKTYSYDLYQSKKIPDADVTHLKDFVDEQCVDANYIGRIEEKMKCEKSIHTNGAYHFITSTTSIQRTLGMMLSPGIQIKMKTKEFIIPQNGLYGDGSNLPTGKDKCYGTYTRKNYVAMYECEIGEDGLCDFTKCSVASPSGVYGDLFGKDYMKILFDPLPYDEHFFSESGGYIDESQDDEAFCSAVAEEMDRVGTNIMQVDWNMEDTSKSISNFWIGIVIPNISPVSTPIAVSSCNKEYSVKMSAIGYHDSWTDLTLVRFDYIDENGNSKGLLEIGSCPDLDVVSFVYETVIAYNSYEDNRSYRLLHELADICPSQFHGYWYIVIFVGIPCAVIYCVPSFLLVVIMVVLVLFPAINLSLLALIFFFFVVSVLCIVIMMIPFGIVFLCLYCGLYCCYYFFYYKSSWLSSESIGSCVAQVVPYRLLDVIDGVNTCFCGLVSRVKVTNDIELGHQRQGEQENSSSSEDTDEHESEHSESEELQEVITDHSVSSVSEEGGSEESIKEPSDDEEIANEKSDGDEEMYYLDPNDESEESEGAKGLKRKSSIFKLPTKYLVEFVNSIEIWIGILLNPSNENIVDAGLSLVLQETGVATKRKLNPRIALELWKEIRREIVNLYGIDAVSSGIRGFVIEDKTASEFCLEKEFRCVPIFRNLASPHASLVYTGDEIPNRGLDIEVTPMGNFPNEKPADRLQWEDCVVYTIQFSNLSTHGNQDVVFSEFFPRSRSLRLLKKWRIAEFKGVVEVMKIVLEEVRFDVSTFFGGDGRNDEVIANHRDAVKMLKKKNGHRCIRPGDLAGNGVCLERSLVMKICCDRVGIPCSIIRCYYGVEGKLFTHWCNEVILGDVPHIVDAFRIPDQAIIGPEDEERKLYHFRGENIKSRFEILELQNLFLERHHEVIRGTVDEIIQFGTEQDLDSKLINLDDRCYLVNVFKERRKYMRHVQAMRVLDFGYGEQGSPQPSPKKKEDNEEEDEGETDSEEENSEPEQHIQEQDIVLEEKLESEPHSKDEAFSIHAKMMCCFVDEKKKVFVSVSEAHLMNLEKLMEARFEMIPLQSSIFWEFCVVILYRLARYLSYLHQCGYIHGNFHPRIVFLSTVIKKVNELEKKKNEDSESEEEEEEEEEELDGQTPTHVFAVKEVKVGGLMCPLAFDSYNGWKPKEKKVYFKELYEDLKRKKNKESYIAPEQRKWLKKQPLRRGRIPFDEKVDCYAFGVLLEKLLHRVDSQKIFHRVVAGLKQRDPKQRWSMVRVMNAFRIIMPRVSKVKDIFFMY